MPSELKKCPACGFFPFDQDVKTCPICGSPMSDISEEGEITEPEEKVINEDLSDAPTLKASTPSESTPPTILLEEELRESPFAAEKAPPPEVDASPQAREEKATRPSTRISSGALRIEKSRRLRNYASPPERAVALAFDTALLLLTTVLITLLALYIPYKIGGVKEFSFYTVSSRAIPTAKFLFPLFLFFLSFFYFTAFHGLCGQTPGKMLMEIMVVDEYGEPPGLEKSAFRFFCYILSAVPLLGGFLLSFFTENNQALHDWLTGTEVIRV